MDNEKKKKLVLILIVIVVSIAVSIAAGLLGIDPDVIKPYVIDPEISQTL